VLGVPLAETFFCAAGNSQNTAGLLFRARALGRSGAKFRRLVLRRMNAAHKQNSACPCAVNFLKSYQAIAVWKYNTSVEAA
jgi:hypothetical protein